MKTFRLTIVACIAFAALAGAGLLGACRDDAPPVTFVA